MHNNIMAAGSRDRPPMLATGRYAQWRSRFLRYIDTRPNGDALRKCILKGPYTPTIVTTPAVPATEDSPAVPEQTTVETVTNMTPENRAHFESEKEAIHLILTGIRDEIYSTVDACQTAQEMWEAIKRLQQAKKGVQLQAEQSDSLADMDEEIDEQELEAHYSYMAKIQEVPNADSSTQAEPLEHVQYDTDDNVFANDMQHFNQSESISNTCVGNLTHVALVLLLKHLQDPIINQSKSHKSYAPTSKASLPTRSHAATDTKQRDSQPITSPLSASASEKTKAKMGKDSTYHKEKMLLCKQAEKGVQLQAEQSDWLVKTRMKKLMNKSGSTLQLHGQRYKSS
ncbi:hypothetical protein Tco_0482402 [Tanacetum coccineum]